ncbi:MAG: heavy-metal-associated domain protein [Herbaspirillum sp.]|nr:heavy-metal-associated domain protein [Herbaspirillum sp.]
MQFLIGDMTCGHCAGAISKAIVAIDTGADVRIDLATKVANIVTAADAQQVAAAITDAGYTPVLQRA